MRFDKIRLKGRRLSSNGKSLRLEDGAEAIPLIELHRYTRLPGPQVSDEEYEWTSARPVDISSAYHNPIHKKKERRRTKILNLIFPARLGDLATAWRMQIETANGMAVPLVPEQITIPQPVFSAGRSRQRGGSFRRQTSTLGRVDEEDDVFVGSVKGKGLHKRVGSGEGGGTRKSKSRYVFRGDEVREVVAVDKGNGVPSSRDGAKNDAERPLSWARAASYGVFI